MNKKQIGIKKTIAIKRGGTIEGKIIIKQVENLKTERFKLRNKLN
jgi:hypothetical protein